MSHKGHVAKHLISKRALELTFASYDLKGFASKYVYIGFPFNCYVNRKELKMREFDAAFVIL